MTPLEDLLMPLAERTLPAKTGEGSLRRLDPRFDALRTDLSVVGPSERSSSAHLWWQLDTTLGAIVRTVAACEIRSVEFFRQDDGQCKVLMSRYRGVVAGTYTCDTPEEAVARCLVALIEAEGQEAGHGFLTRAGRLWYDVGR